MQDFNNKHFVVECNDSRTVWFFSADHTAVQDNLTVGVWYVDKDNFIVKYYNKNFGIATIDIDSTLTGTNIHSNGSVFHWKVRPLRKFLHGPSIGDIIYSLPLIKQLGEGEAELLLFNGIHPLEDCVPF